MSEERVRLDKWLWAARFFRTRSLAQAAIEGGKVWYEGARVKPGREVRPGATVRVRQGFEEKTVIVRALDGQRRGAPEAAMLYEETPESVLARTARAAARATERGAMQPSDGRPGKRDRRLIRQFREQDLDR